MMTDDPSLMEIRELIESGARAILNAPPRQPRYIVGLRVFTAASLCAKDDGMSVDHWFLLNWPHNAHLLMPYLERK